jgi:hypothetical protein
MHRSCIVSERPADPSINIPRHLGIETTGQPGYQLHDGLWDTEGSGGRDAVRLGGLVPGFPGD